jgi:hypothetical protein
MKKEQFSGEWETIEQADHDWTERMKVPGGWQVRTCFHDYNTDTITACALLYVPDAEYTWILEKTEKEGKE